MHTSTIVRADLTPTQRFELKLFGRYAILPFTPTKHDYCDSLVRSFYHQPADWDPIDPPTLWARETLRHVRRLLPLDSNRGDLRLCLSLGTTLHSQYGISAFFALGHGVATLNATADPIGSKRPRETVDFIIYEADLATRHDSRCRAIAVRLGTDQRGLKKALARYARRLQGSD